ncbi:uncharacterized protein LOC142333513 isoform X1 [Lycorma delicatula]|uniref:uncharacterized protein LOC142333513 isoform X1 n=1 Tax=Lycorma delicatula TaxID=130591 RepID=UPI003F50D892
MMLKPRMLFILICCFTSVKQAPIKMHSPKPDTRQPAKSTASKEQPVITMKRSTSEQAPLTIAYIDNLHGKQLEVNYYSTHTQYFKAAINPFLRISFDNNALKTFSKGLYMVNLSVEVLIENSIKTYVICSLINISDTKLKSGLVYKEVDKSNIHYSYEFPSTLIKWRNSTGTDKSTAKVFVTIYNQNNQTLTRIPSVRMLSRIDEVKNTVKIENKKSNGLRDACFNMAVIINN